MTEANKAVQITRNEAADDERYAELRAEADRLGVPLEIVADESGDGPAPTPLDDEPIRLSAADYANPEKYRRARELAEARGVAVERIPDQPVARQRPPDGAFAIRPGADSRAYQRVKDAAAKAGKPFFILDGDGYVDAEILQ